MTSMQPVKEIRPRGPVRGRFVVPGSKSMTNRALVCAALAHGESRLSNASDSDDTVLMGNGLNQMGVLVRREENVLIVNGTGGELFAPKFPIPVQNAGTTLRFLMSLAALARGRTRFEGSERMGERPIDDLLSGLGALGVSAVRNPGVAKYDVTGGSLAGGEIHIRGDRSSQFLSSLLLVAPYAGRDVRIIVDGALASAAYVGMTCDVMRQFGAAVGEEPGNAFVVRSGQRYTPTVVEVETDASGATYGMAAAAIAGGEVLIPRLRLDSRQADIAFARILVRMGCAVTQEGNDVCISRRMPLRGVDVDMNGLPDAVPTLAAVALFADGPTSIRNVAHLRYKESDRLGALEGELRKLGARTVIQEGGGLEIHPAPLTGTLLETYDDHRLAMAFSLIGLRVPGMRVRNPGCVRKSFPRYWEELERL